MAYTVKKVEVWAGDTLNRPGRLARVLEALNEADAELEFLIARRVSEKTSRIFVAPLIGKKQKRAAVEVGLVSAVGMHALRIEGPDRKGLGAELARAIATADINIRGASAATMGRKTVFYLAFKTEDEAKSAAQVLRKLLRGKKKR
ncbi:MAG: ACT domain-containing protein [Phycisphaerae bacterium]|nr:ACT domain-containing protein [Phycisphaerae bacterium]